RRLDLILADLKTVTGIPLLEGYEWSALQDYALAKSKAFVRIVGAADQDSGFHSLFVKQMHDAGKAGVRAAMARMAANAAANKLLLSVTRDSYSKNACLAVVATTINPNNWKEKPCTSFEEYVASTAARTLRSGTLEREVRQDVPGGDNRVISWAHNNDGSLSLVNGQAVPIFSLKVDQTTDFNNPHGVSFTIDLPDKSVQESNRRNNLGGFFYY